MSRQLIEAIRRIGGGYDADNVSIVFATVKSVNQDDRTCVCIPINDKSEAEIPDVNISALPNDGELKFPQVDSVVIIARTAKNEPFILKESDLELYLLIANSIQLNGDDFGGVVKIDNLKTQYDAMVAAFKVAIAAGFSALSGLDGGASLAAFNASAASVSNLNKTTLENTKVKHGNG